jgi:hypothetical protein
MRRTTRYEAVTSAFPAREAGSRKSRRSRKAAAPLGGRRQTKVQRGLPPVLVRGVGAMVQMPAGSRNSKPRRRYDVALSIPGAEVRLPTLPAFQFSWRILSGLMALVLAAALYFAWNSPMFQVETPKVSGLQRLTETDIDLVLGITGQPVFTLYPPELRQQLAEAFPELSHIDVKIALPAEVVVEVVEREPVLVWSEDGKEVWLDAEGIAFTPRGEAPELPVVEGKRPAVPQQAGGEQSTLYAEPALVTAALKMGGHAPEGTSIAYSEQHGLGWQDYRGWQVYFGTDLEQIDMKLQVYEAVVDNLDRRDIHPELISLEHLHAPYYRLER